MIFPLYVIKGHNVTENYAFSELIYRHIVE